MDIRHEPSTHQHTDTSDENVTSEIAREKISADFKSLIASSRVVQKWKSTVQESDRVGSSTCGDIFYTYSLECEYLGEQKNYAGSIKFLGRRTIGRPRRT